MQPLPTLLFDLDGTLTDPKVGITTSIQYALQKLGCDSPTQDELTWCIGPPLLQSLIKLVGEERAEQALVLYRERFAESGLLENEVYPGVKDVLTNLHGQGRRLLVATSKPTVYADTITSHFGLSQFFESVHGSELDGTNSNKADLLGSILGGDRNAVMTGDRSHDMIGAKANGIPSIGVLWGYGSREELEAAGADQIAAEPLDLLAMTALL